MKNQAIIQEKTSLGAIGHKLHHTQKPFLHLTAKSMEKLNTEQLIPNLLQTQAQQMIDKVAAFIAETDVKKAEDIRAQIDLLLENYETWEQLFSLAEQFLHRGWIVSFDYCSLRNSRTYSGCDVETEREIIIDKALAGAQLQKEHDKSPYLFRSFMDDKLYDIRPLLEEIKKSGLGSITESLDLLISFCIRFNSNPSTREPFPAEGFKSLEVLRKLRVAFGNTIHGSLPETATAFMEDDWGDCFYRMQYREDAFGDLEQVRNNREAHRQVLLDSIKPKKN